MLVAAIYDVHGNLPALEAVLDDIRRLGVEQIVVGGDVIPGPMPVATLECLAKSDIPASFICGNTDREVLLRMSGVDSDWYRTAQEVWREPIDWTAEQLGADHHQMIASWPATLRLDIESLGPVMFCHATPRSDQEIFTQRTPDERLLPIFDDCHESIVVCGHTHMQFDRLIGSTRVVNAGSVGMPFGEPGAYWLLINEGLELRRTAYDLADASRRIQATGYPQADEFSQRSVSDPPSTEEMLDIFEKAELN